MILLLSLERVKGGRESPSWSKLANWATEDWYWQKINSNNELETYLSDYLKDLSEQYDS